MIVLLVVDMQVGLFEGHSPRWDADGVIDRINSVASAVRAVGGMVVFIQHDDPQGGSLEPGTEGWEILPQLDRTDEDLVIRKRACDSFYETELPGILERCGAQQLIITGCATDFCVDTTVRAAASRDYDVVVVADGHTTKDRPHLDAVSIIRHHNWMWRNLILPRSQVKVLSAADIVGQGLAPFGPAGIMRQPGDVPAQPECPSCPRARPGGRAMPADSDAVTTIAQRFLGSSSRTLRRGETTTDKS